MKNRNWKKMGSAVLAAAMFGSMVLPVTAYAQGGSVQLQEGTTTQTNTAPELVFLNHYGGLKRTENFNDNWKFYLGDAGSAETPSFDDSAWKQVTLPHDYSIDQAYNRTLDGESGYLPGGTGWYRKSFVVDQKLQGKRLSIDFGGVYMNATVYLNGTQLGTHPYGYTPFSFDITDYVKFGQENVIAVRVDHKTPSSRFYSGSGIYRDVQLVVTDAVHVDKNGTKVESPNLKDHADGNKVPLTVKTTVVNETDKDTTVTVKHTVYPKGAAADKAVGTVTTQASTIKAGSAGDINAEFEVNGISLWNLNNPQLYTVKTEVLNGSEVVDTYETDYGFRFFEFHNETGFSLNGQKVKLKGVCMHHDQGALGAVANDRSTERQVEILKEMGCNSIRVTHNPASDELIDACNKHGILLIEEAFDGWIASKNGNSNDYARWFNTAIDSGNKIMGAEKGMTWAQFDLTAMIKRGQNDPAIIMWSLGNEMWEGTGGYENGYKTAQDNLIKWAAALDTTRPVTTGDNKLKEEKDGSATLAAALNAAKGMVGMNYASGKQYDDIHKKHPDWRLYGSETASAVNSRGIYKGLGSQENYGDHDLTSYDTSAVGWGSTASSAWYETIKRDYLAGEYVWTGFDYIGEPTPWNDPYGDRGGKEWPSPKNSYFGIIDTAGLPKDTYYFYQSQWNDAVNTLHILPAWNENVVYKEGGKVPVVVYSDAKSVELWFRDAQGQEKQIGERKTFDKVTTEKAGFSYQIYTGKDKSNNEHENLYLKWMVPYENGTIFAKAFDESGKEITTNLKGRTSVSTAGAAKKLDATADRETITANGADLSYITVNITDENGNLVPDAANKVTFEVSGDGVLAGVDNGRPIDHQSYRDNNRKAFNGQVVGIVRSTKAAGTITVKITADGLQEKVVTIKTQASGDHAAAEKAISSVRMPKNYYVKINNQPQLPQQLDVVFTDGTTGTAKVVWEKLSDAQISKTGTFSVGGTVTADGVGKQEKVYVNINMIDTVTAILNYSTTTSVGVAPVLPTSRPAVVADGTVLTASFPVEWTAPEGGYNTPGDVLVKGTAKVFGQDMPIQATVRVQAAKVTIGDNIAKDALPLKQDLTVQSDTLEAIRDGSREVSNNTQGGKNTTQWSNYDNSQQNKEDKDAEITFEYATKQNFKQIKVFFRQDGWSASYPDPKTTEIYVSDTGEKDSWTKVDAVETIAKHDPNAAGVTEYTYDFQPVGAVCVKLRVVNNSTRQTNAGFTCTAIAEAELYQAKTADFETNTTAKLASLTVDDVKAPEADLAAGGWSTAAKTANKVVAVPADNAAVTVLPTYEDAVRIILESEDHKTRKTFVVNLDADPKDASNDYDNAKITAKAGSVQEGNELEKAFDKDEKSFWHTQWKQVDPTERWVEMEFAEPQYVTGLRYLPRPGDSGINGNVKTFKIQVKSEADAQWMDVPVTPGTQEWSSSAAWKLAKFVNPVQAKYVRFSGVETYDDQGGNKYMNAAEIRVKVTDKMPEPTVKELQIKAMPKKTVYAEGEKFDPTGLVLTVKYSDNKTVDAVYGKDNGFTFEPGLEVPLTKDQQKVTVGYAGQKADILVTVNGKAVPESLQIINMPAKLRYTEGEKFNPAGLELKVKYSDGTFSDLIVYGTENAGQFRFDPSVDTALTPGVRNVVVTYGGLRQELGKITVEPKQTTDSVEIQNAPTKLTYVAGEHFDPTGLVLTVKHNHTTEEVVYNADTADKFGFTPSLETELTQDVKEVTISYAGKTVSLNITVREKNPVNPEQPQVKSVEVKQKPVKTQYKAGEKFAPEGLVLVITFDNGDTKAVAYHDETASLFTFDPNLDTLLTTDMHKIVVTYGGQSANVYITVVAADTTTPGHGPSGNPNTDGNTPQTGDNSHIALLAAITAISGLAIIGTTWVLVRKRKK